MLRQIILRQVILLYVIVPAAAATALVTFSVPAVRADPGDKMTTVQAVEACRAELGKHAKYMDVRACVVRKKKGE